MTFGTNVTTQADDVGGIFEAGISGAAAFVFSGYSTCFMYYFQYVIFYVHFAEFKYYYQIRTVVYQASFFWY